MGSRLAPCGAPLRQLPEPGRDGGARQPDTGAAQRADAAGRGVRQGDARRAAPSDAAAAEAGGTTLEARAR